MPYDYAIHPVRALFLWRAAIEFVTVPQSRLFIGTIDRRS